MARSPLAVYNPDLDPHRTPVGPNELMHVGGDGTAKLLCWTRDAYGALCALLDHGDHVERLTLNDLMTRLTLDGPTVPPADPRLLPPSTPEFEELPPAARERILAYVRHLLQVDTGSLNGTPELDRTTGRVDPRYDPLTTTLTGRVKAKSAELRAAGHRPHSPASIYRGLATLATEGMTGFVHGNRVLGRDRLARHDPRVVELGRGFVDRHATEARVDQRALAVQLHGELHRHDLGQDLTGYGVRRLLGDLTRGRGLHKDAAGRRTDAKKPLLAYDRWRVAGPCDHVQIDGYRTGIALWSAEAGWSTATILTAVDVYTHAPLALRVLPSTGTGVTARDAAGLLWDIGRPAITRAGWPYEMRYHHGIPHLVHVPSISAADAALDPTIGMKLAGIIALVILDHGSEFTSAHFLGAAARMGTDVLFCPPAGPHHKGIVERLHLTYAHIEALLGGPQFTGNRPTNRPRDVEGNVVMTAGDLHDIFWTYLLDIYMHTPHDGLREAHGRTGPVTPAMILEEYLLDGGTLDVPTDPWSFVHALETREVTIQDGGITIDRRRYNCPELVELRQYVQRGIGLKSRVLTAYFDRYDVSRIYLRHVITGDWMVIPRAGASTTALPPYSDLLTRLAVQQQTDAQPLTPEAIHHAEVKFHLAWGYGAFTGRRDARMAAIEASRAHSLAHDLADTDAEFRAVAYPDPVDPEEVSYGEDPEPEDDILDYDEIFGDRDENLSGQDQAAS
ncbi:MAG: Mu transposase C-terminal domain-containing protein [Tetrasphaera sp.]